VTGLCRRGSGVGNDDVSLAKAAADIGTTIFHPVGTAKIGTSSDPLAVVDERLRFYGIAGLRVADADDHLGQHQHADGDDRGERCDDDFGGWAIAPCVRVLPPGLPGPHSRMHAR
jgi:GMC oxidoreductase